MSYKKEMGICQYNLLKHHKVYICMYPYNNNLTKRGHEFEREQGSAPWEGLKGQKRKGYFEKAKVIGKG